MSKKIILFLIILVFMNHCGFEPLHLSKLDKNFSINKMSFEGDRTINNYLKVYLKRYENNETEKNFTIKINSEYKKNTLSKNKKAKISNYKLLAETTFEIILNDEEIKKITISDKRNIEYMDDKLEEEKYERVIKQSFASTIADKLITELSTINAN